jgi:hypothetical protein
VVQKAVQSGAETERRAAQIPPNKPANAALCEAENTEITPKGIRTPCSNDRDINSLQNQAPSSGAKSGAFPADSAPEGPDAAPDALPPDVADLARRLAALPESVRAAIAALLSRKDGGQ